MTLRLGQFFTICHATYLIPARPRSSTPRDEPAGTDLCQAAEGVRPEEMPRLTLVKLFSLATKAQLRSDPKKTYSQV